MLGLSGVSVAVAVWVAPAAIMVLGIVLAEAASSIRTVVQLLMRFLTPRRAHRSPVLRAVGTGDERSGATATAAGAER